MSSRLAVRIILHAISPRLAINNFFIFTCFTLAGSGESFIAVDTFLNPNQHVTGLQQQKYYLS